jgi:esterase/lipase superfamily enzyme
MSHSLGGRLMLEAVSCRKSDKKAKLLCLTAAAVDNNCLSKQYRAALEKCDKIVNLASKKDRVLKYLYPAGDFVSDILGDNDSAFRGALGRAGPNPEAGPSVEPHQIRDDDKYDHGNYLPPDTAVLPASSPEDKWPAATRFMINAFRGLPQNWP